MAVRKFPQKIWCFFGFSFLKWLQINFNTKVHVFVGEIASKIASSATRLWYDFKKLKRDSRSTKIKGARKKSFSSQTFWFRRTQKNFPNFFFLLSFNFSRNSNLNFESIFIFFYLFTANFSEFHSWIVLFSVIDFTFSLLSCLISVNFPFFFLFVSIWVGIFSKKNKFSKVDKKGSKFFISHFHQLQFLNPETFPHHVKI